MLVELRFLRKTFYEEVKGTITLEEAKSRFENELVEVLSVSEEKYGDYTVADAKNIIENEGTGYAVTSYCSYTDFRDEKVRELWKNAGRALEELEEYVGIE